MRLILTSFHVALTFFAKMVMPRSRSRSLLSRMSSPVSAVVNDVALVNDLVDKGGFPVIDVGMMATLRIPLMRGGFAGAKVVHPATGLGNQLALILFFTLSYAHLFHFHPFVSWVSGGPVFVGVLFEQRQNHLFPHTG